ncbi:MAG: hydrogenase iron-sulfur subunit [Pirellulaceae bacterium]|jgi:F420-non-reducing hydrogenase iron-sulfur subunit|nr:hydrogenase iron-sulfur subunit [Pirellulaceae bacterium]
MSDTPHSEAASSEPRIVAFMCNWCSYTASDLAGTARIKYSPYVRIIRVMCSGRVDPTFVLKAFALGADGVMIAGCHPGDCHYIEQNYKTIRRVAMVRYFMEQMGIDADRLRLVWASAAEGQHLAESIDQFVADVRRMGPLNWSANWDENDQRLEALEDIVQEHAEAMEVQA